MVTAILKLTEFASFDHELRKRELLQGRRCPSNFSINRLCYPALTMYTMKPNSCIRQAGIPTSQTLGVSQCPSIITLNILLTILPSIQLLPVHPELPAAAARRPRHPRKVFDESSLRVHLSANTQLAHFQQDIEPRQYSLSETEGECPRQSS